MSSEVIALQFIVSFLPNVLVYIETMATSRETSLNSQEALDFTFASSSKIEFEDELDDVNGEPEI